MPEAEPASSFPIWTLASVAPTAARLGTCRLVGTGSLGCQEQISRIQGGDKELARAISDRDGVCQWNGDCVWDGLSWALAQIFFFF